VPRGLLGRIQKTGGFKRNRKKERRKEKKSQNELAFKWVSIFTGTNSRKLIHTNRKQTTIIEVIAVAGSSHNKRKKKRRRRKVKVEKKK